MLGQRYRKGGLVNCPYSVGGKFPKRVVPLRQMQQCTAPSLIFHYYLIMPTLKLSHDEVRLLNDMFSCISDLGLFEGHDENEQDSSPDVFDKLWDKVTQL